MLDWTGMDWTGLGSIELEEGRIMNRTRLREG
jgi:hypothetical protein